MQQGKPANNEEPNESKSISEGESPTAEVKETNCLQAEDKE